MNYNWTEIFKSKTDKELYEIYKGKSFLNSDAQNSAFIELKNRNFNFNDIDKYKKQWELESLIDEENYEIKKAKPFFKNSDSYLLLGILGLIIIVWFFIDYFIGNKVSWFSIIVGISMIIFGFIGYNMKKNREMHRKNKIGQLKGELNNK